MICLENDQQCALYSSATRSAVGRKDRSSLERGLETKESGSGHVLTKDQFTGEGAVARKCCVCLVYAIISIC